ncbi:unnamed protein product [Paramecium primaurelia]|uniref:Uncharacterized protein n=1 Tax=Paramecium primaurelia TaxID=5886 RepID=A0A8S1N7S3_PARPR|nr:unnamed protein product [Paramecium primaurelia]
MNISQVQKKPTVLISQQNMLYSWSQINIQETHHQLKKQFREKTYEYSSYLFHQSLFSRKRACSFNYRIEIRYINSANIICVS